LRVVCCAIIGVYFYNISKKLSDLSLQLSILLFTDIICPFFETIFLVNRVNPELRFLTKPQKTIRKIVSQSQE